MKNILLIGLGRFGKHIAMQLNEMGHEIMAVDINEARGSIVPPCINYLRSLRQGHLLSGADGADAKETGPV